MGVVKEPSLYLASQSPRRRELLQQIGVSHQVVKAEVIEVPRYQETPRAYVQRLAGEKSLAGFAAVQALGLALKPVMGADTIVVMGDRIFEKPLDAEHAAEMLQLLSGDTHQVMTAVALTNSEKTVIKLSVTDVVFRVIANDEITRYWLSGEPYDKAGGYGIQGLGAVFVEQLRGSYTGVVGLPIEQTVALLQEFSVPWWQRAE